MATRRSGEVERRRSRVRGKRAEIRPPRQASRAANGSSHDTKSADADHAPPADPPDSQTSLYDVLHHFSEALAIIETVSSALQAVQNNSKCTAVGSEIATLRQGVAALVAVHQEFDLAFSNMTPIQMPGKTMQRT
jgi:hypothetical protein